VLTELRLENYAVIENLTVKFANGLNLLTGETGAGKSILIDGLGLLLGEKASSDVIRAEAERAVVSAVFDVEGAAARTIATVLENNGIDVQDDSVILRREIAAGGKSRAFVNNQPATVAVLKQLAPQLAGIHAQNESLLCFDAAARLALLDAFAGTQCQTTAQAFAKWKSMAAKIHELEADEQDRLRLLDLWSFQKQEIEGARVQAEEDERLQAEKRILANAEKIHSAAMNAFDLLYEGDGSTAATVRAAQKHIEELARYEPKFQGAVSALESARISIEDVGAGLRDFAGGVEASPERLAEVEERLASLDRLKRKYGPTLVDVIQHGMEVSCKLSDFENKDEVLRRLRGELAEAAEQYLGQARSISKVRRDAALKLEKLVESEINELAMKANFRINLSGADNNQEDWTTLGFDKVEYMISANAGEPLRRLEQTASGGELSRVMLALKATVEARSRNRNRASQRTLVFDEIDTGIGGRAAEAVGKKLKALSRSHQVLCVTHLPQIATFADHHYLIEKKNDGAKTRTSICLITGQERTEEVARMLSGAKLTESSRQHAEQMLKANA
jgi:DNA repair protein RecN (Recombination protein N)